MEAKNFLASKTVVGAVVMLIVLICKACGVEIGDADATAAAEAVLGGIGFVLTVYGRVKAKGGITMGASSRQVGIALIMAASLGMAATSSGCALKDLDPHEQAMAAVDGADAVFGAAVTEYDKLLAGLPEARAKALQATVGPIIDRARDALVLLWDAAILWGETREEPSDWSVLLEDAWASINDIKAAVAPYLGGEEG